MSHGDTPILLKPGIETQVRAPGDFVFLKKAAFPVEVNIRGQIVEMEPGEVRNIPRNEYNQMAFDSFTAKSVGAADQQVVFVVGEGSYNKVIVSGQLNVSAYVETALNGQAKSLPMTLEKTFGVESIGKTDVDDFNEITSSATHANDGRGVFYWAGYFYKVNKDGIRWIDENTAVGTNEGSALFDTSAVSPNQPTYCYGADINSRGEIFFFGNATGDLYVCPIGSLLLKRIELAAHPGVGTSNTTGFAIVEDIAYWAVIPSSGTPYLRRYDTIKREFLSDLTITGLVSSQPNYDAFGKRGDKIYVRITSASDLEEIDKSTGASLGRNVVCHPVAQVWDWAFSPDFKLVAKGDVTDVAIHWATDSTFYGKIWVQDGSDAATRKSLWLESEPAYYQTPTGYVFLAGAIEMILAAANRGKAENYLDYVTAFEFFDGSNTRKVGSGTQSFTLRGIADNWPTFAEGPVKIELLPEFFDQ